MGIIVDPIPFQDAMDTWWMNLRDRGGLRLSEPGFAYLESKKIQHYDFDIDTDLAKTPGILLLFDQKIDCAYYLSLDRKGSSLSLFGEKPAIMASLYGNMGSFLEYLRTKIPIRCHGI